MLLNPTELSGARPSSHLVSTTRYTCALDLDVHHACSQLLADVSLRNVPIEHVKTLQAIAAGQVIDSLASRLTAALRHLLLLSTCTVQVAHRFHPILLHLLAGVLDHKTKSWNDPATQSIWIMFGLLLPPFEEIYPCVVATHSSDLSLLD